MSHCYYYPRTPAAIMRSVNRAGRRHFKDFTIADKLLMSAANVNENVLPEQYIKGSEF